MRTDLAAASCHGHEIDASRFVNADGALRVVRHLNKTSSIASGAGLCVRPRPRVMHDNSVSPAGVSRQGK
jgi:hypothetical protein